MRSVKCPRKSGKTTICSSCAILFHSRSIDASKNRIANRECCRWRANESNEGERDLGVSVIQDGTELQNILYSNQNCSCFFFFFFFFFFFLPTSLLRGRWWFWTKTLYFLARTGKIPPSVSPHLLARVHHPPMRLYTVSVVLDPWMFWKRQQHQLDFLFLFFLFFFFFICVCICLVFGCCLLPLLLCFCLLFVCFIERESMLTPMDTVPSASGCRGAPPLDAQINLPFVLYCLMLSSWLRWPSCVAVVMRLYAVSFQVIFFLFFSYCSTEPRILFLLCRLVWCAGHFFFIYFFVDVVCPLSLSHLPHTFILRIPFIQTLCSGRSFRSFLSFSVLCLLASFRCPLQLTSRKS